MALLLEGGVVRTWWIVCCARRNSQLEAPRVVDAAGDRDLGLSRGGLDVVGYAGVAGGPVDKVDEEDGKGAGVGVDGVPGQGVLLALGEGRVALGGGELDGRNERRREGQEREEMHCWSGKGVSEL